MKVLGRVLVLLLAALLVSGATWAFAQSNLPANLGLMNGIGRMNEPGEGRLAFRDGQQSARGQRPGRGELSAGQAHREGFGRQAEFGGDAGLSLLGIEPLLKNLGIMAAIIAVVAGIAFISKSLRKSARKTAQAAKTSGVV